MPAREYKRWDMLCDYCGIAWEFGSLRKYTGILGKMVVGMIAGGGRKVKCRDLRARLRGIIYLLKP